MTNVLPFASQFDLPSAMEAEQALLGAIMVNNASADLVDFLNAEHFEDPFHRLLYQTIRDMVGAGRPVTPITLKPYLPKDQTIGTLSGFQYLCRLASNAVTVINAPDYGRAVLEAHALRKLVGAGEDLAAMCRSPSVDAGPDKLLAEHMAHLGEVADMLSLRDTAFTMNDAVTAALQATSDAYRFQKRDGVSTGIEAIDKLTGPWEAGQLVIFGGGTKQGKTALALQASVGIAENHGPVWIYSGEMSPKQLAMREVARRTGIPVWRQRDGRLSQDDWVKLEQVNAHVAKLPIFIEKRRLTLEQIASTASEIQRRHCLAAIVIDHAGLVRWEGRDSQKDEWTLSARVTQEMKALADRLGIVVVVCVQLKKNTFTVSRVESFKQRLRQALNNRPTYTDLMGAVERDADHVIIPFNARPILASIEPEAGSDDYEIWEAKMQEHARKAEIILALSREQQFPARQDVIWNGETTSFERWQTQPTFFG